MTAHLGNWELLALYFARRGYQVNVLAQELYHKKLDNLLSRLRRRLPVKIISRGESL
ncbi:hypothetical protein LDC_0552, partial [sediment metagenome]